MNKENTSPTYKSDYDIVVIGSGAGGATFAQKMAKTGKSILVIERGDHLPVEEENWDPREVFIEHRYRTKEEWRDRRNKKIRPNIHYWVGGNTIFYGAALYRFRKGDFGKTIHHGGAVSPEWPISYDDLAPYYLQGEHLWNVHGTRGEDPTDDADAPAYKHAALLDDPEVADLKARLRGQGVKPFSMPMAVERDENHPETSACIRCKTCGGFPCKRKAKSDGRKMVDLATNNANVTLLTGAKVSALETDGGGGRVSSVHFETSEGAHSVKGDIVVLAAGAVNSAAILLASAQKKQAKGQQHANGLANSSDQVGRNYMFHTASASLSFAWPKIRTTFPKTLAINDYYWKDPDGGFDFPMGHVQMLEYLSGDVIRGQASNTIPSFLIPKGIASFIGDRVLPFLVMTEDLPEARNRVTLTESGEIKLSYWHNNLKAHSRLIGRFHTLMGKSGRMCKCLRGYRAEIDAIIPVYGTAHQCGTLRMGNDPKSSVVDANCRAHDLDNLYVVDTSVFCSSAAVNPALTAIANSLRVADIITDRLA